MRIAALLLAALALPVYAQRYVRESIGTAKKAPIDGPSLYNMPVAQWVGEKLVFMPKARMLQEFGYKLVEPEQPYEVVGTVVTISTVTQTPDGYTLELATEDGRRLTSRLLNVLLDDISVSEFAPVRDIEWARQRWLGKQVWLRPSPYRVELMIYDAAIDELDSIEVKNLSAVTVTDVVASDEEHAPVRLVMRTKSAEEGYVDVTIYEAPRDAILSSLRHHSRAFFEDDPRLKYKWPVKIWNAIEQQKVFAGMTKEQVRLSWGHPSDIKKTISSGKTREQWVFGRLGYVYFTDGIVTLIQN
jgi:hypothetical protein